MNDTTGREPDAPEAHVTSHSRFSLIWLIPIIAAAIAAYLGWQTISSRGPLITITFQDAGGLTAGQTKIEHKSVALGTVESVRLSKDLSKVIVSAQMTRDATPFLTNHARFWIVRPQFTVGNISGLETLLSGRYIAMDPGPPGGEPQREFVGLNEPPGVRSDEPGRTFTLSAARLGSLTQGSPVFFRDIQVGEVLGYDRPRLNGPITLHIFIKAPYDDYVRENTHFWNVSGLSVQIGPQGVHVEVASLQAVLSGGVAFANFGNAENATVAKENASFPLYADYVAARNAGYRDNIPFVTYFHDSVSGLSPGSAVLLFGIQVGTVTSVALELNPQTANVRVRVTFDIQPERVFTSKRLLEIDPIVTTRKLVQSGMRAQVDTQNLLTGQEVLALNFVPNAGTAEVAREGNAILVPSHAGGFGNLSQSLGDIMAKLNALPIEQIGDHADHLLASLDGAFGGPELKDTLRDLSTSLTGLRSLIGKVNAGATPALERLPEMSRQLQETLTRADRLLASMQSGYGTGSELNQSLQQVLAEADATLRSVRLLADFLERHPSSLIFGRH